MQSITLRDVSRKAGVSLAMADRVMNGRPSVRAVTMERMREAIDRLGYQANPLASRLARGGIAWSSCCRARAECLPLVRQGRVVLGKRMEHHLRFAVAYWHQPVLARPRRVR